MTIPPPIDIVSSSYAFDAESDLPYPGTWYLAGSIEGMNGFVKRTLSPPFDVFQAIYDEGYDHGVWNKQYTVQTSL